MEHQGPVAVQCYTVDRTAGSELVQWQCTISMGTGGTISYTTLSWFTGMTLLCIGTTCMAQEDTLGIASGPVVAQDGGPVDSITTTSKADSARLEVTPVEPRKRTSGTIEVGGMYGAVPFMQAGGTLVNGYTRGQLSTWVLGLPVGLQFDLGTDAPTRGQRQHLRFQFDPLRAAAQDGWNNAYQLRAQEQLVDSLVQEQAHWQRVLIGQQARIAALRNTSANKGPSVSAPAPPVRPGPPQPELPLDTAVFDTVGVASLAADQRADSLERGMQVVRHQLEQLDAALGEARSAYERQRAISQADAEKVSWPMRFVRGIQNFELGTCTPQGSEFLINGTTLQGVSFSYLRKDLFVALDRGRSFDDTWRSLDGVGNSLRRIQQSLFITDAQDLDPRQLTAVRVGVGAPDGTHVHVGYLHGRRNAVGEDGSDTPFEPAFRTNHVVEVDAGVAIKKHHLLRLVHARSVVLTSPAGEGEQTERTSMTDLFTDGAAEAWKASWTTQVQRTGTRLVAEGRYLAPWFQSFGVGFLRSGSRAVETRLDQTVGERIRLRVKGTLEERTIPSADSERTMELMRAQLGLHWKPVRSLDLNATYLPVVSRWEGGQESRTDLIQLAAVLRKRWERTVLHLSATSGVYRWSALAATEQVLWNQGASLTLQQGERWNVGLSYNALWTMNSDTLPTNANISVQGGYRIPKKLMVDACVQMPVAQAAAWSVGVQRPFGEHFMLGLRSERFARFTTLFNTEDPMADAPGDRWTMSLTYHW